MRAAFTFLCTVAGSSVAVCAATAVELWTTLLLMLIGFQPVADTVIGFTSWPWVRGMVLAACASALALYVSRLLPRVDRLPWRGELGMPMAEDDGVRDMALGPGKDPGRPKDAIGPMLGRGRLPPGMPNCCSDPGRMGLVVPNAPIAGNPGAAFLDPERPPAPPGVVRDAEREPLSPSPIRFFSCWSKSTDGFSVKTFLNWRRKPVTYLKLPFLVPAEFSAGLGEAMPSGLRILSLFLLFRVVFLVCLVVFGWGGATAVVTRGARLSAEGFARCFSAPGLLVAGSAGDPAADTSVLPILRSPSLAATASGVDGVLSFMSVGVW